MPYSRLGFYRPAPSSNSSNSVDEREKERWERLSAEEKREEANRRFDQRWRTDPSDYEKPESPNYG